MNKRLAEESKPTTNKEVNVPNPTTNTINDSSDNVVADGTQNTAAESQEIDVQKTSST